MLGLLDGLAPSLEFLESLRPYGATAGNNGASKIGRAMGSTEEGAVGRMRQVGKVPVAFRVQGTKVAVL